MTTRKLLTFDYTYVRHLKMIEILKATGIDRGEILIISNFYWQQIVQVKLEGVTSEAVRLRTDIRQGCVLSPLLFNIYSEAIFKEALDCYWWNKNKWQETINLRYADDTVVLADNM